MTERFSIATFNLYNLQKAGEPVYEEVMYSDDSYDRKAGWIGRQLTRMNADIVGFQEVWSLEALQDAAVRSDRYQNDQVHIFERDGGPAVGLASRLPVSDVVAIADFPEGMDFSTYGASIDISKFSRPVLRAKVKLPNDIDATVYVAHLKSKRPRIHEDEDKKDPRVKAIGYSRSLLVRAAEAAALRWIVMSDMEGTTTPVVVIGDLNDGVSSVTTSMISGDRPFGGNIETKRKAWDVLLYSTYELQAKRSYRDVYYTHIHDQRFETLDHILVSEELSGLGPNSIARFSEMEVWNDHINDYAHKTRSDHAQVVARFRMESD